jgi:hypothetical protein
MSRKRRLIWVIVALIAILGIGTTSVAAKARKTCFSATQRDLEELQAPWFKYPGGNIHGGDQIFGYRIEADDPRATGDVISHLQWCNLDANWVGPCGGTMRLDVAGRGFWEGRWHIEVQADGSLVSRSVAHGGGEFKSMLWKGSGEAPYLGAEVPFTVCILDPHGE